MITLSLVERLALRQYEDHCCHWYCHYCLAPLLRPGEPPDDENRESRWMDHDGRRFYIGRVPATIDHVIPRSKGGSNDESNLVLCCAACNSIKGNRPAWVFEAITKEWMWRNRHFMQLMHALWADHYVLGLSELEKAYGHQEFLHEQQMRRDLLVGTGEE